MGLFKNICTKIWGGMVRPKASRENIRIAIEFADIVTFHARSETLENERTAMVARKGRYSIFAAFSTCLPELAREAHEKHPRNRSGVALVELNKALVMAGLHAKRIRDRKGGTGHRHFQVFPFLDFSTWGFIFSQQFLCFLQFWANRRWADPTDPRDVRIMVEKLCRAQQNYPEFRHCTLERLQSVISSFCSKSGKACCEGSDNATSSECDDEQESAVKKNGGDMCLKQGSSSPEDRNSPSTASSQNLADIFQVDLKVLLEFWPFQFFEARRPNSPPTSLRRAMQNPNVNRTLLAHLLCRHPKMMQQPPPAVSKCQQT
jgi:hypothetical protein